MISDSIIEMYKKCDYKIKVNLIYFNINGKYKYEGEYMEDYIPLFEIWEKIEKMEIHPGLSCRWNGLIYIEVPDHMHNHPHILNMSI